MHSKHEQVYKGHTGLSFTMWYADEYQDTELFKDRKIHPYYPPQAMHSFFGKVCTLVFLVISILF